ncbi:hypothetical protein D1006_02195 [Burkholderia stabilis]|uniref:Uncharacterized protein n=2 Tax=Burkholderia stabilis TaxID=95485 RepID=A0A4Q2AUK8_9BURK|nr:hypothetical protein D1006_02195 [Burkholderia stabilis]
MPGWATATAAHQQAETSRSTELYSFELPFIDVLDEARTLMMKNGTVDVSEEHVIAGENTTRHYQYVIAVTPAKSNPNRSYLWIDISMNQDRAVHGTVTPHDESGAFIKQLGEKLNVVPKFVTSK